jgi:hypothetical protein
MEVRFLLPLPQFIMCEEQEDDKPESVSLEYKVSMLCEHVIALITAFLGESEELRAENLNHLREKVLDLEAAPLDGEE